MENIMQTFMQSNRRSAFSGVSSLIHPSKEMFYRQRALLRKAMPAGIPVPLDDRPQQSFRFDEHLIKHSENTFFMRAAGDSMRGLNIFNGDLLVVDRASRASHGSVVIAVVNGEFTVRQLIHCNSEKLLRAAHPDYADLPIQPEHDFAIWGVVRWNVHQH